jgi:hypothetical protein
MFNNPLPAADFYRFACSFDLAGSCQQRCDLFFDEVANETRAVNDRRRAYLLAVAPELTEGIVGQINADQIYVDRRFSLRANLVHGTSWFDGRTPAHVGHYEQVKAPAMCESDSCRYIIVSAEWKNIIEQFDPGIHEFFPHVLRFVDGYISNRYIFRSRGFLPECYGRDYQRNYHLLNQSDRHWMNEHYLELGLGSIVSRGLAVELHNLLCKDDWIYNGLDDESHVFPFTPIVNVGKQ